MPALLAFVLAALVEGKTYAIEGVIRSRQTDEPLKNALVVLQCRCIDASREAMTDERGQYRFGGLPPGTYTIQVLRGEADVSKVVTLPP